MKTQIKTGKFILWGLVGLAGIAILVILFLNFNKDKSATQRPAPPIADYWPTQTWRTSTPEEQGLDSAKLAEGLLAIKEKGVRIHSLLIVRNGRVLLDAYFYPYDGSTVHDMASVTKSITTTLIAIAVDQGKLKLEDPMLSFFPDIKITNPDPRIGRITVRDLTMMANGLESTGMAQDEGTLALMEASDNFLQNAVDRRMAYEPGTQFVYDSPGMHILSGILQNKTGMTELDFARQNLFAPLGIKDVIWPLDPQGYTYGWGNICLHPRDAAKIGYLWLNQGVWEGKQIVPKKWVEDTSRIQIKTGLEDDYSYGWWLSSDNGVVNSVFAQGRGGQYIKLIPSVNALIVTTASGMDYDEIDPYIIASAVDLENPLPPNPDGVARLNKALKAIQQAPLPQPVPALPETAKAISGRTYLLEANPAHINTVRFEFNNSNEAKFAVTFDNTPDTLSGLIGLDGVLHMAPGENGLPAGNRGYWSDMNTFIMENETIANREAYIYTFKFDGDRITVEGKEHSHNSGITISGTAAR
jgi:CubicO group peptidase (beta-lactamase class C family)